jgi:hypothetical protein
VGERREKRTERFLLETRRFILLVRGTYSSPCPKNVVGIFFYKKRNYINHKSFYIESKKAKNKKYIDAAKKATNWKNFFELIGLNPQKIGLKQRKRITEILLQENFNFSDSCLTPEP